MALASWFSAMRHSRCLTRTGSRRNCSCAFHRRASFEALEDRHLLSTTVNFGSDSEIVNESAGTFTIPVTLSGFQTPIIRAARDPPKRGSRTPIS